MNKNLKILMSGGGTGGHIFPAIAIAKEIQNRFPNAEFLFIGANGKMEMQKVPEAGYTIKGLDIAGFDRGNLIKNITLPIKLIKSLWKALRLIKEFQPDLAIGTGGFASGPALFIANKLGIPIYLQEQNSLPGKTNIFIGKNAKAVFTAYPEMQKYFPNSKVHFLGNPVRESIVMGQIDHTIAKEKLGLSKEKLTILSVGGSLGSRTLNTAWKENLENLLENDLQLIWQTGRLDYQDLKNNEKIKSVGKWLQLHEFISDMALAYSAADIIVSRAGAIAISELAIAQKPILLVPFPYAAEDHQTKNAEMLVQKNASKMVKDIEMKTHFWNTILELVNNESLRNQMRQEIVFFAKPNATKEIVDEILKDINKIKPA